MFPTVIRRTSRTVLNSIRTPVLSVRSFSAAVTCPSVLATLSSSRNVSNSLLANTGRNSQLIQLCYSSSDAPTNVPIVEYGEIKDLPNHPEKLLIDVREPKELAETGQIPTSINIPLGSLPDVFSSSMKPEIFQKKYGRSMPTNDTEMIFTCRSGVRALKAAVLLQSLGFHNVKSYKGSWMDWAEHEGLNK